MGEGKTFSVFSVPNCVKDTQNSYSYSKYSIHTTSQSTVNCICVMSESDLECKFPPVSFCYTHVKIKDTLEIYAKDCFPQMYDFQVQGMKTVVLFQVVKSKLHQAPQCIN